MGNDSFQELSLDEIQNRLNNLESDRAALEQALVEKRAQTKKELADEIKEMIHAKGYEADEIADMLVQRKRATGRGKSSRAYTSYVDPANPENVYVRGVLPGWMKEQMVGKGLDPKNKDDRKAFKSKYLKMMGA